MNIIDEIIASYRYILAAILLFLFIQYVRVFIAKFTTANKCPHCQATDSERIPRSIFTKVLLFHKTVKKFKCLKCWKTYYVVSSKA